jgi:hypothetical protein
MQKRAKHISTNIPLYGPHVRSITSVCKPLFQDYQELVRDLQDRLSMARSNRPIVVFLDSLEQLSPTENAHLIAWLPRILPSHVHVVVSTIKDDRYACLSSLRVSISNYYLFNIRSY